MPDLSASRLEYCAIHYVGNKHNEEGMVLSKNLTPIEHEATRNLLLKYFLSSFREDDIQRFSHHTELNMNEVYTFAGKLFADPEALLLRSVELATHLYETTLHPNVPGGEVCVAYFEDCYLDGHTSSAIGLFKTENKEKYLHFDEVGGSYLAGFEVGINVNKPDKACLIFNQEGGEGYKVLVLENGKNGDTQYWREKFLGLKPASDDYHFTSNMLRITKEFVTKEMPSEFPMGKAESIDILNRSLDYFKNNDSFEIEDFAATIFEDERVIDSFKKYDEDYCKYNELPMADSFEIDNKAVKKQAKVFKSVLKLDKNFHIYIHGNKELIEKGVEADGRKFYKIYFEDEE